MAVARLRPIIFMVGLVLAALVGVWLARGSLTPLTASDVEQARFDVAAPLPRGPSRVGQTFTPTHNGLSAIELLAVVYADGVITESVTLRLLDAAGAEVATRTVNNLLKHNDPVRLTFAPQPHSAGQTYTLWLEGTARNQITVWAYTLDGYARGAQLTEAGATSGDLRFTTTYTYLWPDAAREGLRGLGRVALLAPVLWLLLFAPGQLALGFLFPSAQWSLTFWARAGLALVLSLSLLPLAWLWVSTVGLRWSALTLGSAYVLIGLLALARAVYTLRATPCVLRFTFSDFALLCTLLVTLLTRLLAIRDLAAPMWVDSSHHLLIARLLAETGHIPVNYEPLLSVDKFYYHWGYHVLLVGAHWLSQMDWPKLMLLLGQVLNALMPLAVYTGTELLTQRPRAGLVAAWVVGLVSFFPGYYLSWGRYTQLVGLLILAPLVGLLWQMVRPENGWAHIQSHLHRWRLFFSVSLIVAGLFLAHYRVLAFLLALGVAVLACGGRGGWKWLGGVGLLSVLLVLPWLIQLFQQAVWPAVINPARLAATSGYNDFPVDYFRGDLERGWLVLSIVSAGWGLLRRERALWVLGGWAALTFALLNIGPGTWVVNNNAWAISLFVPAAMALGWGADRWLRLGEEAWFLPAQAEAGFLMRLKSLLGPGLNFVTATVLVGLLTYAGARGLWTQANILNPATRLVLAEDMEALAWVEHNTAPEAVFAINSWKWLNNAWAGSDGGAWLWPLIERRTTLPPVDYLYQREPALVINNFNQRLAALTDANSPEALALLREINVTHIFIGARGGSLKPEMFVDSPHYRLLFSNGAAWVFEVTGE